MKKPLSRNIRRKVLQIHLIYDHALQVPRIFGDDFSTVLRQYDGIRMPEPAYAWNVDARFDAEYHACFEYKVVVEAE